MNETRSAVKGVPQNVFTLPTPTDITITPFWSTIQHKSNFLLQKSSSPGNPLFRNLMNTIASVFDTKQPPYRILFQREPNAMCLQIAVADTENLIQSAWQWIERNMIPELEAIDHPIEKEYWVSEKINMIVTAIDSGTDELSSDHNIRSASRTFRQIFDIPPSERFVNYYSCAYKARQGWLYLSENYIGFHSFILGTETKLLIELKDIQDIKKERSKGIFDDSIRIITKDKEEFHLSNMFKRDEIYDILLQLSNQAMQKLLKHAGGDAPGASNDADFLATENINKRAISEFMKESGTPGSHLTNPLKQDLEAQKRNQKYCLRFRLPINENLLFGLDATYSKSACTDREQRFLSQVPHGDVYSIGRIYLSQTFLTFESQERLPSPQQNLPACKAIFPLYTIKRVEKIRTGPYTSGVSITTWHRMTHEFNLQSERTTSEEFCETLKGLLLKQVKLFKCVKKFVSTFESEQIFKEVQVDSKTFEGGLGLTFGFPENSRKSKDRSKTKLWKLYFQENGRNLTMIRVPTFGKLVRVGLPSAFRGEIWEASSGAMYLRFANRDLYSEILEKYKDQRSTSTEEIEKDLNRSLPEYPGYQTEEGLNRLRRVLTAYSWNNPELGYCQAMNIVTSALLIYTTEEQAFWILHVLVDRMCPGYYSTNMYGALLDQIIFEKLVERTMPLLWNHFKKTNVELSVACLPWFLSLYINSMPLEYAVRVLDMLFMEGPRILFQIGLAILKLNGEELLKSGDDGSFLDVLKSFFQSMGVKELIEQDRAESVKSTRFNQVMLTAYREFSLITDEMITELRSENQLKVGAGIESFTKRTIIRHLKDTAGFTKEEIAILYDKFYGALYYANHEVAGKSESSMNQEIFHSMLASMTLWAKNKSSEDSIDVKAAQEVSSRFIERLYISFAGSKDAFIDFQKMIIGMNEILHGDIMSHLDWFFDLYDEDDLQMLTSKNIIDMSKELYWLISVLRDTDIAWDAVTNLIVQSCEQSDVAKGGQPDEATLMHRLADLTMKASSYSFHSRIKQLENSIIADLVDLTIPSFRMVALTNETLEMFFDYGFKNSFKLVKSAADRQKSLVREVFENLFEDGQKLAEETPSQSSISREKSSNSLAQIDSSPPITKSPSGQDVKLDEEVDTLINEMDTFDVWSN